MLHRKPKRRKRAVPLVAKALGKRLLPKPEKRWECREHLDRVKAQSCLARHLIFVHCDGPIDPHHCRKLKPAGLMPRHDYLAVPLCRLHHKCMDGNERACWSVWGIDPRDFIRSFSKEGAAALAALERTT